MDRADLKKDNDSDVKMPEPGEQEPPEEKSPAESHHFDEKKSPRVVSYIENGSPPPQVIQTPESYMYSSDSYNSFLNSGVLSYSEILPSERHDYYPEAVSCPQDIEVVRYPQSSVPYPPEVLGQRSAEDGTGPPWDRTAPPKEEYDETEAPPPQRRRICGMRRPIFMLVLGISIILIVVGVVVGAVVGTRNRGSAGPEPTIQLASLGCWTDGADSRALPVFLPNMPALTNEKCMTACNAAGYNLAGTEDATECWCGTSIGGNNNKTYEAECKVPCTGSLSETCGGSGRITISQHNTTTVSAIPPEWKLAGCYQDQPTSRLLSKPMAVPGNLTVPHCLAACEDYAYAGVEYGIECYCGATLQIGSENEKQNDADCSMPCVGDDTIACGGSNRINVYAKS